MATKPSPINPAPAVNPDQASNGETTDEKSTESETITTNQNSNQTDSETTTTSIASAKNEEASTKINGVKNNSSWLQNPLVQANSSSQPYEHVMDTVLKLFCTHCEPNYELPWAMTPQTMSTSSAFVIPGRKILTNAHSVEHYTSVKVKRRDNDTKYTANVVAIGNECDIALLSVDDESFWSNFKTDAQGNDHFLLPGPLPHLQDSVLVIGYPSPGNQISVTAGVTSRVEMHNYVHGQGDLLTVQIDAAINPGNSGGPVINEHHQVIGIAFQSIDPSQADSIGYFIPYCVVQHFLDDIENNKRYTSFPYVGFRWQRMENPTLRRAKKLPESESGVLVKWVAETSDVARVLRKGDVVTHFDGVSVSNAGTIPFRSSERIGLDFLVTSKFCNDLLTVTIRRDGEQLVESYKLSGMGDHRLVPVHDARHLVRRQPEYIVFGGLVFQTLTEPLMRSLFCDNWQYQAPVEVVDVYYRGTRTKKGVKEIVVLAQVLATDSTDGYESENQHLTIVKKVNGEEVSSLKHLAKLIDAGKDKEDRNIMFELDRDMVLIISRDAAAKEEKTVLTTHCIPAPRSLSGDSDAKQ